MKSFVIRFGLIAGIIMCVIGMLNWFFIAKPLGYSASEIVGYLSIIVALLTVPVGIKYYRDKLNDGAISFGEGFKIGAGISLIASIIMYFYSMVFFTVYKDEFMAWSMEGKSAEELAAVQAQIEAMPAFMMEPWAQGFIMLLTVLVIGLIISLISSAVLKSNNNPSIV